MPLSWIFPCRSKLVEALGEKEVEELLGPAQESIHLEEDLNKELEKEENIEKDMGDLSDSPNGSDEDK